MSRRTGTEITARHLQILEFANEYYYKNRVGPLYNILKNKLGAEKKELEALFPNGLFSVYSWIGIPIQDPNHACKPIAEVEIDDFREVYFDHNSTTELRDEVKNALSDFYTDDTSFGNPSSSNKPGKSAYETVFNARSELAAVLDVSPTEIIFTGCGSEANNTAIKGIAFQHLGKRKHIISNKTEHPSVLNTLSWLEKNGFEITLLDVPPSGIVSPEEIRQAIRRNTILIAVMAVNNEIGTINPIEEIGAICRENRIIFMVDAVQAFGKLPLYPKRIGIDLMSFSAHKIHGPKGIGALYVDDRTELVPLIHGGEQEFSRRAGTENTGSILAFGKAATLANKERSREFKRLESLHEHFLQNLESQVPGWVLNGSRENKLPNVLNIGFPDVDSGALLLSLNQIGIYVSSGSACSSGSHEESHVIKALGVNVEKYGSIRFSLGRSNTIEDIDYLFQYLPDILKQLKLNGRQHN